MAIGCEPSTMFCKEVIPDAPAYISKYQFTLGFKKASSLIVKGYVHEVWLLVIFMFSDPYKSTLVIKWSTSVLVYVIKINADNSSSVASVSDSLQKLGTSRSLKNSTDLSKA